eukprot:832364_1
MSQWTCNVCTYLNHPALPKCEICESDRESKPLQSVDGDLEFAKRLQEQFGKESTPQTQTKTNSNHNQPPKQPNSTSSSNSSSNHKSKPVPSTDADLEFAKRLQEQFDKESHQSDPSPIPTNDNHNRSIDSIPKPQSNDAPTSNSNSNSQKSTTESNKRSILPAPVPISNHKPPNADSTNRNRRRKRKRSEMESDSNVSSERHHHQCKIKEEEMKHTGHYHNQTDIVERIDFIRTGYEDLSHHNQMSVHVSPNTSVTGSAMSVFAIKGQPYSPSLTLFRSGDFPYLTIDFNTTQVKVVTYAIRHPMSHEWMGSGEWGRVGDDNFMKSWVLEGNNDLHSNNWQIIHRVKNGSGKLEAGGVYSPVHFSVPDGVSGRYFTKIRLRMTALNSSGARTMKLAKVKLYGVMRRKVYQFPRRDEYKTIESFPAITKNKCIGDIDHVFKILNESESLEHHECKEYVQNIPDLKVQLKDYQRTGLQWLLHMENTGHNGIHGGLLCDEMGLGKTVQIIALMLVQKQKNPNERTLIITPLSLIDQWIAELSKIADPKAFKVLNYYGQQRKKLKKPDFTRCNVVLSTTDTFKKAMGKTRKMWDDYADEMWMKAEKQELLFKLNKGFFDRIVVDESHEIKKIDTVRSKAICTMASRCKYKWCLTGTPVNNDITYDLGGVSRFLGIERNIYVEKLKLTDKEKKRYLNLSKAKKQSMWLDLSNDFCLNRVKAFIKPIMLRRVRTKKSQKRKKSRKRKPPTNQSVFPSVKRRKICDQQDHKPQPMPYKKARALHKKNNRFMGSSGSDRMDNENGNMNNIKPNVESHTQKMSVKQFLYNTIDGYKKHWANTFQFTNDELETTADGLFRMYRFSEMMHKHLQTIQTQCNIYTAIYDKEETESLMNTHGAIKNAQSKHNIYTLETIDWRKIQLEHWQKTNRLRTLKSLKRKADEFVNHKPQPTTPMLHRKRSGCIADSDSDNYHTDNENRFKPNAPHIPANDHAEYNYYNTNHNQLNALDPMDTDEDDEQQTKNDMANVSFISNVSS